MHQVIVPVRLGFKDAAPNSNLSLTIFSPHAGWSLGENIFESGGLALFPDTNMQPYISKIALSYSTLAISTSDNSNGLLLNFDLSLFLIYNGEKSFRGIALLNSECKVFHEVDNREPSTWENGLMLATW